jgi:ribosomal protein L37AE/L43A
MSKKIHGKWRCRNCGLVADGSVWNRNKLEEGSPSITKRLTGLGDWRATYLCPRCNEQVELSTAEWGAGDNY